MEIYKVLVVDDSALMRKILSEMINTFPAFQVVGKARNGIDALEKMERLQPDIVTMDIEMPKMDGIEALRLALQKRTLPIIMLSNGTDAIMEALELGAVDFIAKMRLLEKPNTEAVNDFEMRLHAAIVSQVQVRVDAPVLEEVVEEVERIPFQHHKELLIIGSSTGGPQALQTILTQFPSNFNVPIFIIQHMPVGFTKSLANRFHHLCNLPVKEAEDEELLLRGHIYIAEAGFQTVLVKEREGYRAYQHTSSTVPTLYKPSIDVSLLSVAEEIKDKLLTVILTGMGDDGLRGCRLIKKCGAELIAEAEESCVVYGMPKVVYQANLVDCQQPLPEIFAEIMRRI